MNYTKQIFNVFLALFGPSTESKIWKKRKYRLALRLSYFYQAPELGSGEISK